MKKLIPFSLVTVVILAPNIALSKPEKLNFSDLSTEAGLLSEESEIVMSLFCDEEVLSLEEIEDELDDETDGELSDERLSELASFAMSGQQIPTKEKAKLCDDDDDD